MDDKNKEVKTDAGNRTERRIDIGSEFRESFDHAAITQKYMEMSINYIIQTNPLERVIIPLQTAPDEIKKDAVDRSKKTIQTWLDTFDSLLTEGKTLSVDLIGYAADLARKKRTGLK